MWVFNGGTAAFTFRDGKGDPHSIPGRTSGEIPEGTPVTKALAEAFRTTLRRMVDDSAAVAVSTPVETTSAPEAPVPQAELVQPEVPARPKTPRARPQPPSPPPLTNDTPPSGPDGST